MAIQRIAPPGNIAELAAPPIAPVEFDRGFLIGQDSPDSLIREYHNKANLLETPACEVTGVPLIIHPECGTDKTNLYPADDHHPEHPRLHSRLESIGGLAVRHSRVQKTNYWVHHLCVHETFRGPLLPKTSREQFMRTVFNAAGLIPERAVYFHGPGEYSLVLLPKSLREQLWQHNILHVERPSIVSEFIRKNLYEVSLQTASDTDVSKLLSAGEPAKGWEQAKRILSVAALEATKEFSETFKQMYDRNLLPPGPVPAASIGTWRAHKLVMGSLGNRDSKKSTVVKELQAVFINRDTDKPLANVA